MQQSRNTFLAVSALLALMALLAGGAARRESITVDEVAHTGAGVSYLQKLDMRMNEEHPPLAKLAALPLFCTERTPTHFSNPGSDDLVARAVTAHAGTSAGRKLGCSAGRELPTS